MAAEFSRKNRCWGARMCGGGKQNEEGYLLPSAERKAEIGPDVGSLSLVMLAKVQARKTSCNRSRLQVAIFAIRRVQFREDFCSKLH